VERVLEAVAAVRRPARCERVDDLPPDLVLGFGSTRSPRPIGASIARARYLHPPKSEPLLRLLIADPVGEKPTRESLATLRADIADLEAALDDAERSAATLPHRRKYLRLANISSADSSTCTSG
jgi:hypothetical protein